MPRAGPWRRSTISIDGRMKSVARMTSAALTPGPAQRLLEHERDLDLDERPVHPAARHRRALEHEPVVEQRAVVGLGGTAQRAHRLRRQPDLVALHQSPGGDLQVGDGLRDPVGVGDVGVGIGDRDRLDRHVRQLGVEQRLGRRRDLGISERSHGQRTYSALRHCSGVCARRAPHEGGERMSVVVDRAIIYAEKEGFRALELDVHRPATATASAARGAVRPRWWLAGEQPPAHTA